MINDSNESLVNVYRIIQNSHEELIRTLGSIQREYHALTEHTDRRAYFMEKRTFFNEGNPDDVTRAALFIFFMRTCYNGIYSVNRSGKLSVTFGAGKWRTFRSITLPLLKPTLLLGAVLLSVAYLQFFEESFVMTQGGPLDSTLSAAYYVYQKFGFGQYGIASAASWVLFIIIALVSVLQFRILKED